MFDNIREKIDQNKKDAYLKEIYEKKLEEINGAYEYPYELFLKNVERSERNELVSNSFIELIEKTYGQNGNLKEILVDIEEKFRYPYSALVVNSNGYDLTLDTRDDGNGNKIYEFGVLNGQQKYIDFNFCVSPDGTILSIDVKYTYAVGVRGYDENRYDKYSINKINEEIATVEQESLVYDDNLQKQIVKNAIEVPAQNLSR